MNEPFGRQPLPVLVTIEGEDIDIGEWLGRLQRAAEYKGDVTVFIHPNKFKIYPRAVND